MFVYKYEALDSLGNRLNGVMYSKSSELVSASLKLRKLQVICVRKALLRTLFFFQKSSALELSLWSDSVYQLLHVGMNISNVLEIAGANAVGVLKSATMDIKNLLTQGYSFSKACLNYRYLFGDLFLGLIEISEQTGQLDNAFLYISKHYSFLYSVTRKIKMALYYPMLLGFILLPIMGYFIIYLIPMFAGMILDCGGQVPFVTSVLCGISYYLCEYYFLIFAGFICLIIGFMCVKHLYADCLFNIIIKVPFIGKLLHFFFLAVFFHVLGQMLSNGMSLVRALEIGSGLVKGVFAKDILQIRAKILLGQKVSAAIEKSVFIPELACKILAVGEQSNTINKASDQIGEVYNGKLQDALEKLHQSVQPIFMVIVGLLFMVLVVGGILPLYQVISM